MHDLLEFYNLNREGFRKVLKKHDKVSEGSRRGLRGVAG
jgi:SPX domain protein involved in polyphosphate accumulation